MEVSKVHLGTPFALCGDMEMGHILIGVESPCFDYGGERPRNFYVGSENAKEAIALLERNLTKNDYPVVVFNSRLLSLTQLEEMQGAFPNTVFFWGNPNFWRLHPIFGGSYLFELKSSDYDFGLDTRTHPLTKLPKGIKAESLMHCDPAQIEHSLAIGWEMPAQRNRFPYWDTERVLCENIKNDVALRLITTPA